LLSSTVTVSAYKTINEPIQQHTEVRFNGRLRWSAMNLPLQQIVTDF